MAPYIFTLIVNLILAYCANYFFDKKLKKLSFLFILFLIAYNTVFAGLRNFGVGIDTTVYIDSYFDYASSMVNIKDFFNYEGDLGFLGLAFLATKFSNDSQALLVVTALFIFAFFYLAIWRLKKLQNINIFVCNLLFCIVFYCHTLNLMRQFCAIALLVFAFTFFIQKRWYVYIVLQIVAYFFHSTSVLFIIVPVFWQISLMKSIKIRNLYAAVAILGFILLTSFYFYFLTLLGNFGLITEVYADRYSSTGGYLNTNGSGLFSLISIIIPLLYIYYSYKRKAISSKMMFFIFIMCIFSLILIQLSRTVRYTERLAFYTNVIYFIFLSHLMISKRIEKSVSILYLLFLLYSWYRIYIVGHGGDILPYTSKFLNIW